ncbi:MAG: hypothetical protein NTV50_01200 [Planctomycetota bacterium]|nr:hypothetical protein [Planctomycetota bacterium]
MPAIISVAKSACVLFTGIAAVFSALQIDYPTAIANATATATAIPTSSATFNTELQKSSRLTLKISQIRFSPDSKSLAVLSGDRHLSNWPVAGGNPTASTFIASIPLTCLEWTSTGESLYVGTSKSQVLFCDPKTLDINFRIHSENEIVHQINNVGQPESLLSFGNSVNSLGKLIQGTPTLWHNDIHSSLKNIPDLHYTCMSRQQDTGLFAFGSSTGEIILVDLFSNTEPIILAKVESSIDCLKWTGKNLIATSEGTLHLIDSSKNQAIKSLQVSAKPIRHIEISNDEKTLFMAAGSETVQVRDAVSGNIICKLASINEMVSTIALSPDGKTLAVGTCQGHVTFWDTSDFQIKSIIPAGIN